MFVFAPEKLKIDDNINRSGKFKTSIFTKLDFRLLKAKFLFLLEFGEFSIRINSIRINYNER